jgi:PTH1 family peptidyl-tRNA hydrolase
MIKAIVGLGNPEPQYEWSPHNAGYCVIDSLARRLQATLLPDASLEALVAVVEHEGTTFVLAKPTTGMNDCGRTVASLIARYNLPLDALLVVYDDVSLPMGRMRFQHAGGAGGHHGIENTIACLAGERQFTRLKVAVGPDPGGAARFTYVTSPLTLDLRPLFTRCAQAAEDAVLTWAHRGLQPAMNGYNGIDLRKQQP